MTINDLLKRLWFFDAEVFAHDCLFVFMRYDDKKEVVFHNSSADELNEWLLKEKPILCGYNCNNYDKHILRAWIDGYTPEDLKDVNDYIIGGGNGWDLDISKVDIPVMWDLFNEINPRKSLKELEGNLRLDITETTIPFDLPTKWTEEQYKEVLYYCEHDVQALFSVFDKLINKYKSKFIIAKLGNIEPEFALSQTDANLTAILLGGKKEDHYDNFAYEYPKQVDKSKIPKEFLNYIDDLVDHNDLDYKPDAPLLDLKTIDFQVGVGGGHGFIKEGTLTYDRGDGLKCE